MRTAFLLSGTVRNSGEVRADPASGADLTQGEERQSRVFQVIQDSDFSRHVRPDKQKELRVPHSSGQAAWTAAGEAELVLSENRQGGHGDGLHLARALRPGLPIPLRSEQPRAPASAHGPSSYQQNPEQDDCLKCEDHSARHPVA